MTYDMKVFDHIILITLVGSVSLLILSYPISPLIGSILYFALPSTYLIFRKPNILKIAIIPAFIFGFLFGIGFEYLNEVGGSWVFPLESQFVFPSFFFDTVPLDVIIWYILWVFTIICYYEYLIDRPSMPTFVSSRIYKLLALSTIALSIIAIAVYGLETDIVIPYTYTITGLISLIPVFKLYHIKLNKEGGGTETRPNYSVSGSIFSSYGDSGSYSWLLGICWWFNPHFHNSRTSFANRGDTAMDYC